MARKKPSDPSKVPAKLFYRINEVSSITGVEPYVLRYWEGKFPILAPEKDEHDQRRYRQKDIELIQYIKKLLYDEKYTVAGAADILKQGRIPKARGSENKPAAAPPTANGPESNVVLIVQDEPAGSGLPKTPSAHAPAAPVEPHFLEELQKRVGAIREDVHQLVSELKKWQAHSRSTSR